MHVKHGCQQRRVAKMAKVAFGKMLQEGPENKLNDEFCSRIGRKRNRLEKVTERKLKLFGQICR